jgi:Peptidase family M28
MTLHRAAGLPRSALVLVCSLWAALMSAGCSQPTLTPSYPVIDGEQIRAHLARLDAAEADGIEPGSRGEQLADQYLSSTLKGFGLSVQTQPVTLTKITPTSTSVKMGARTLRPGDDFVAWTRRHQTAVVVDAEMIFMGYGISTPRQGWDDYKGVDVRGKMLVMLIGSPHNGARDLLGAIGGDYYGRRRYKFEEARRRGAAGVFLVRIDDQIDDEPELSWQVLKNSTTEILDADTAQGAAIHLAVEGWMTTEAAREVLHDGSVDFDEVKRQSAETNFRPVPVPLRAVVEVRSDLGPVVATNVIGTLKGTLPDYVLYSSQWNDLPAGGFTGGDLSDPDPGNQPPPGAAVLLEVAHALAREPVVHRTFVFLFSTAGSEGLLGLDYYLNHPIYPLKSTRAGIHLAGFSVQSGDSQISIIGDGFQGLKDLVREEAAEEFRVGSEDTDLERMRFFRPGEAGFTESGVPSIFLVSRPLSEVEVEGEVAPARPDMSVGILDAQLMYQIGLRVATANNWPKWKPVPAVVPPGTPARSAPRRPAGIRR